MHVHCTIYTQGVQTLLYRVIISSQALQESTDELGEISPLRSILRNAVAEEHDVGFEDPSTGTTRGNEEAIPSILQFHVSIGPHDRNLIHFVAILPLPLLSSPNLHIGLS
jgi:hypothetical protein